MTSRAAVLCIFVTVLVDTISFGIILPVTPELIMELTGEGLSDAARYGGWLWFVYAVMQFFCAPIMGNLGDRFGRRPVILACLGALGLDYLVMGFAPAIGWLFAGRAIAGMAGASFTAAYAYLADVSAAHQRAQNFGLVGAAFGLGFILGPAIGGLLGELGPRAPFFAAAGIALANFAFGFFVLPESLPRAARRPFELRRANPLGTLLQLRRHPAVFGLLGAVFLWQLGHQALPATWSFYTMFKFGWSEAMVGVSLAFVGVIMALSQGVLTRVVIPRFGERRVAATGLVVAILTYAGYAFATQGWQMFGFMLGWGCAALVYPSLNAILSQNVPANAQGELQGGVACLYSLSAVAGPPLMSQLFGYFSAPDAAIVLPGASFLAAALLTLASLVLFVQALRAHPAPALGRAPAA